MQEKSTNEYVRTSKGNNDECYTYRYAVEPLLEFLKPHKEKTLWCPFDTEESEFVKVFTEHGYKVINSHIDYGQDFYKYEPEQFDLIISNPPFTNKTEMFKRILSFNKPFAILMSVLYLNDGTPYRLFKDIDLQLLLFPKRMTFKRTAAESAGLALSKTEGSFNARSKQGQTYTNKQRSAGFSFAQDCSNKFDTPFASRKINFMSCYFCKDFLPKQIIFRDFTNTNQLNLFKEGEL